ncbi:MULTISPECIES: rhomboid family intramembrane serine protease [unclassified Roseovarius]|jgi:membrane associated rhomboid family serine protease|uniref:rhomboid family intramembrane serine protease n=1 Tax=unclassified Roseovarius TaxID=2614913 RepID=UPI000325949E|nr:MULTISPECIES: rhomboid family intramembrane serine protease [unclassified Roseovarius]KJS40929.1 MAG: protease [Roseovarius sp. BRH_c41]
MSDQRPPAPVNPLPPFVIALFLVIVGVEAAFTLGARGLIGGPDAVGWRSAAIQDYGFNGEIMAWMLENRTWPMEHLRRFVTYAFVHGSFTHALFAGVLLLAMGKFVSDVFRHWAVLVLFLVSTVAGALVYGLVVRDSPWLIGAFPGVYGLIGGFTYIMWLRLGQMGTNQARAFTLIGVLMGLQLVFGLLFGGSATWVADVSGFATGFLASFVLSPGGWSRVRAKLRHD